MSGAVKKTSRKLIRCPMWAVISFLWIALLIPSSASAAPKFSQIETFGGSPVVAVSEIAVNESGAGGVEPGTVYVVGRIGGGRGYLQVYKPDGAMIRERELPGEFAYGIAVDQTNGMLFVLYSAGAPQPAIERLSPDGELGLETFGERAGSNEEIATTPAKVHFAQLGGIAVDGACNVYVSDTGPASEGNGGSSRIMLFKPHVPGGCEQLEYAGRASDITSFSAEGGGAGALALDAHGHIYSASENTINEFTLGSSSPVDCRLDVSGGGIAGMTVDPENEEVFYDSIKDGLGHQLVCQGGSFRTTTNGGFSISPPPTAVFAVGGLAFNASLNVESGTTTRPDGVLYAGSGLGLKYVFAAPIPSPPVIESEFVSRVGSSSATLNASLDSKGLDTRYVFQYLPASAFDANPEEERFNGAAETPLGGALLEGRQGPRFLAVSLGSLAPDTEYRYRIVATGIEEGIPVAGAAKSFLTFPRSGSGLPDGRHYELVSPPAKEGGEVFPLNPNIASCAECKPGQRNVGFPIQVSSDGQALAYEGEAFGDGGASLENEYLARRTSEGWTDEVLSPRLGSGGESQGFKAFDPSLSQGILYQVTPSLSSAAPSERANFYRQVTADPDALSPLIKQPGKRQSGSGTQALSLIFGGSSANTSKVFFAANDALTAATGVAPKAADGGASKFNLYEWSEGSLSLVNVAPGNKSAPAGASFVESPNAVSADGSNVFWTNAAGELFVRRGATITEAIADPGKFIAASQNGEAVLLNDGCIYSLSAHDCVDLTKDEAGASLGGFMGLVGTTPDLGTVFFADSAVLTGPNSYDRGPIQGEPNLYDYSGGKTRFVATLSPTSDAADWRSVAIARTAEASPNGIWLAFASSSSLTGYENVGPCTVVSGTGGEFISGPCEEVYLYNASSEALTCVSCNRSGSAPLGPSHLPTHRSAVVQLKQPYYLTDSGRLVFDSQDSLLPGDVNGGGSPGHAVEDVYEFEPAGIGSCADEAGCLSLISTGSGTSDSNFLAMDSTGENIFFTTRDQLSGSDRDQSIDIYDAREGAEPGVEDQTAPPACVGEACQIAGVPPAWSAPASSIPLVSGSRETPACKRDQVKRGGKCVKKARGSHRTRSTRKHHHKRPKKKKHVGRAKGGGR
jgi:hypothetical protein